MRIQRVRVAHCHRRSRRRRATGERVAPPALTTAVAQGMIHSTMFSITVHSLYISTVPASLQRVLLYTMGMLRRAGGLLRRRRYTLTPYAMAASAATQPMARIDVRFQAASGRLHDDHDPLFPPSTRCARAKSSSRGPAKEMCGPERRPANKSSAAINGGIRRRCSCWVSPGPRQKVRK